MFDCTFVPVYRYFNFGKRVSDIKNDKNYFITAIRKIVYIISTVAAIMIVFNCMVDTVIDSKDTPYLISLVRCLKYIVSIIIIVGTITRAFKEAIYECGIKTSTKFIKWNEINEIVINDKTNDVKFYYRQRWFLFIKVNDRYIFKNCSDEIINVIYDYWNVEKAKVKVKMFTP